MQVSKLVISTSGNHVEPRLEQPVRWPMWPIHSQVIGEARRISNMNCGVRRHVAARKRGHVRALQSFRFDGLSATEEIATFPWTTRLQETQRRRQFTMTKFSRWRANSLKSSRTI